MNSLGSSLSSLTSIRIILVEPAGPLNVGSIARVMKNMGLNQLVLVNPQCDPLGLEARKMAVHAGDLLDCARHVTSLSEALEGCFRAIATTARPRYRKVTAEPPRQALPWLLTPQPSALIFGREDSGLNNQELELAQRIVTLPVDRAYESLNLAQAVGVCCYELRSHWLDRAQTVEASIATNPGWENAANTSANTSASTTVPLSDLEGYFEHLESTLLKIGYLHPHTVESRMQTFRQIYKRSQLSSQELAMLRGILRQTEWAVDGKK